MNLHRIHSGLLACCVSVLTQLPREDEDARMLDAFAELRELGESGGVEIEADRIFLSHHVLMNYWADLMQDDVYVLVQDGWIAGQQLRELMAKKGEKLMESPDLVIGKRKYKAELIPPELIIQRFYATEQAAVEGLQAELDIATQTLESYIEENSGEGGSLSDAMNDKDKVTKASVAAQLKKAVDGEEVSALKHTKQLFEAEANAKKSLKDAQDALLLAVFKHYPTLSEEDIKTLIVDDKWLASLKANVQAEIERITQQLTKRVKELEERYAEPLPAIEASVVRMSEKVAGHLKAMGLSV